MCLISSVNTTSSPMSKTKRSCWSSLTMSSWRSERRKIWCMRNATTQSRFSWITYIQYRSVGIYLKIRLHFDRIQISQIGRVVQQLQSRPYYLFLYLDALMTRDPNLVFAFSDLQVCPVFYIVLQFLVTLTNRSNCSLSSPHRD